MKKYFLVAVLFGAFACNTTHNTTSKTQTDSFENMKNLTLKSDCPREADCTIELMKNKKIEYSKDGIGMLSPNLKDSDSTHVIKYEFNKNQDEKMMDGQYREEVLFEIPVNKKELQLNDKALSTVNFTYGRFCFCKGSAGYFKVHEGSLNLKNGKLTINFENNQVPQIIKSIVADYEF